MTSFDPPSFESETIYSSPSFESETIYSSPSFESQPVYSSPSFESQPVYSSPSFQSQPVSDSPTYFPASSPVSSSCAIAGGKSVVILYKHCNYGGYSVMLHPGSYTAAQLKENGIGENDVSAIRLCNGARAILYQDDNFQGKKLDLKSDVKCFSDFKFNDQLSSIEVIDRQGQEYDKNIIPSSVPTTSFGSLPSGIVSSADFAWFAENFDEGTGKWTDTKGATSATYAYDHSVPFKKMLFNDTVKRAALAGSIGTKCEFPVFRNNNTTGYTIFHVSRYIGTINRKSILTSRSSKNWTSGFFEGKSGVAVHGDTPITLTRGDAFGNEWLLSTSTPVSYRANGADFTTVEPTPDDIFKLTELGLNTWPGQESDFAVACVVVYERNLSSSEIRDIENQLASVYGIILQDNGDTLPVKMESSLDFNALQSPTVAFFADTYSPKSGTWASMMGDTKIAKFVGSLPVKKRIKSRSVLHGGVGTTIGLVGSISPNYTIIHVSQYAAKPTLMNNRNCIVSSQSGKWISGFMDGKSGTCVRNGNYVTDARIDMHGNDWVINVDQAGLYRSNGVKRSIDALTRENQPSTPENIGINLLMSKKSDFALGCLLYYDRKLNETEIVKIEEWLSTLYGIDLETRAKDVVQIFLHGNTGYEIIDVGTGNSKSDILKGFVDVRISSQVQRFLVPRNDMLFINVKNSGKFMDKVLGVNMQPSVLISNTETFNNKRILDTIGASAKGDVKALQRLRSGRFEKKDVYMYNLNPSYFDNIKSKVFGKIVMIQRSDSQSKYISLDSLVVYDTKGYPIVENMQATLAPKFSDDVKYGPHNMVTSIKVDDSVARTGPSPDAFMSIDLGTDVLISSVHLESDDTDKTNFLVGCTLKILDSSGKVNFAADITAMRESYDFDFVDNEIDSQSITSTTKTVSNRCENTPSVLQCDAGSVIGSGSIKYGRWKNDVCPHKSVKKSTKPKFQSYNLPKNAINSQTYTLNDINRTLKSDPYRNVYKHYDVTYTCIPNEYTVLMNAGEVIESPSKTHRLVMQLDGNLVLYAGNTPLWSAKRITNDAGTSLVMRNVNNSKIELSTVDADGNPTWVKTGPFAPPPYSIVVTDSVTMSKSLVFQCVTWEGKDEWVQRPDEQEGEENDYDDSVPSSIHVPEHIGCVFFVRIYGRDTKGNPIQVVVHDFRPYFYVKVARALGGDEIREVKRWMSSVINPKNPTDQVSLENVLRKDVWGFQNGTDAHFLKVTCFRQGALRKIVYGFENRPAILKDARLYESNLDPVLRLLHVRNLPAAGWIRVHGIEECMGLYYAEYSNLEAIEDQDSLRSPMLVAAIDIECFSRSMNFPIASPNCYDVAKKFVESPLYHTSRSNIRDFFFENLKDLIPPVKDSAIRRQSIVESVAKCIESMRTKPVPRERFIMAVEQRIMKYLPGEGDPVCQIGMTVHAYGDDPGAFRHKSIVTLGPCGEIDSNEGIEVISVGTESDLFLEWAKLFRKVDPDMITGYNIFGFDMDYMYKRMSRLGILDRVFELITRDPSRPAEFVRKTLTSSALGDNDLRYFDIPGRTCFDLMKIVQRDYKLESYKLDSVAEYFTGQNKHDVSPNEIFAAWMSESTHCVAERARVAKYCVQDCALCNFLVCKLNIVSNTAAMATVCSVPVKMIHLRGQGIKLQSLVFKQCHVEKACFPTAMSCSSSSSSSKGIAKEIYYSDIATKALRKGELIPGLSTRYEGATVLTPTPGVYTDPVCVNDFASLYPSSMISENISHDTLVMDDRFRNIPGVSYNQVCFLDDFEGERVLVKCEFAESYEGILPRILKKLLTARKDTRAKAKFVRVIDEEDNTLYIGPPKGVPQDIPIGHRIVDAYDDFQKTILDGFQLALKVCANSLYGQCGAVTSPIYLKPLAACTTATGRSMLQKAKDFMEERYGAKVIYGDSVARWTPVYVCRRNIVEMCTIEDVSSKYGGDRWIYTEDGKESCELEDVYTWTERGWTALYRVIRHPLAPEKKMIRISTYSGVVDVTDDHSLLLEDGTPVSPKNIVIGTKLLHARDLPTACAFALDPEKTQLDSASKYWTKFRIDPIISSETEEVTYVSVIDYAGFVYDLTTANHHFQAGIGRIVVHNTDSVFQIFPCDKSLSDRDSRRLAIDTAMEASKEFRKIIKQPHDLEYEKCFHPMVIFSRKRYAAMKYEFDVDKGKMSSMGIVLKRRDNAPIVKEVYGRALDIILETLDTKRAIQYVQDRIEDIVHGHVDLKSLVVSKTLKKDYKNPETIAHKVLADRVAKREPGNAFQCNDRVPYIHIVNPNSKLLGNRIETPEYVRNNPNKCKIDYAYYITNQISKPVCQLMGLVVEELPGYNLSKTYYAKRIEEHIELKRKSMSSLEWKEKEIEIREEIVSKVQEEKEKKARELSIDRPLMGKSQTSITTFFQRVSKK